MRYGWIFITWQMTHHYKSIRATLPRLDISINILCKIVCVDYFKGGEFSYKFLVVMYAFLLVNIYFKAYVNKIEKYTNALYWLNTNYFIHIITFFVFLKVITVVNNVCLYSFKNFFNFFIKLRKKKFSTVWCVIVYATLTL